METILNTIERHIGNNNARGLTSLFNNLALAVNRGVISRYELNQIKEATSLMIRVNS